jgi:hypothetical protein
MGSSSSGLGEDIIQCRYPYKIYAENKYTYHAYIPVTVRRFAFISSESQRLVPTSQDQLPCQQLRRQMDLSVTSV